MTNSYHDLVKQTFNFPQEGIEVKDSNLHFNGLDLKALIKKYGTPLKLTYLPKIGSQIKKAKTMFANAFKIVTERGTVYVMGRVTQREANSATNVIRNVNGVNKVVRLFEIISEEELRNLLPPPPPPEDKAKK